MYKVIRLTSRPLGKNNFHKSDIGKSTKSEADFAISANVAIDNTEIQNDHMSLHPKELIKDECVEEVDNAVAEENHTDGRKKHKTKNDHTGAEKERKFSIWEEIPDEPRDPSQISAAEIINKDGYYDTIEPIDINEERVGATGFNWKVPAILLGGILILTLLIFLTLRQYIV